MDWYIKSISKSALSDSQIFTDVMTITCSPQNIHKHSLSSCLLFFFFWFLLNVPGKYFILSSPQNLWENIDSVYMSSAVIYCYCWGQQSCKSENKIRTNSKIITINDYHSQKYPKVPLEPALLLKNQLPRSIRYFPDLNF